MKGNLKKGILTLSLAGIMALSTTVFSGCSEKENTPIENEPIEKGYIVLNDEHPTVYRLHKINSNNSNVVGDTTLCGMNFHLEIIKISYSSNTQYALVLEKTDSNGNILSIQYNPYIKIIPQKDTLSQDCYDELCEECFPESIN